MRFVVTTNKGEEERGPDNKHWGAIRKAFVLFIRSSAAKVLRVLPSGATEASIKPMDRHAGKKGVEVSGDLINKTNAGPTVRPLWP